MVYVNDKIVAPVAIHNWLFTLSHDDLLGGHLGPDKTYEKICKNFWWPHMKTDITSMCATCHTCNKVNQRHSNKPPPLEPMPPLNRPYQSVNLDLLNLPTSEDNYKYVLLMIDGFTRFAEAIPLKTKTAVEVEDGIASGWICRHGAPESFHSDLGKEFTNEILSTLCKKLKIKQTFTTPGHPQGNGKVERANKNLINFLRKNLDKDQDWVKLLPYAIFSLNNSKHLTTKFSPHYLLYYNEPVLPMEILDKDEKFWDKTQAGTIINNIKYIYNEVIQNNQDAFIKQKKEYDKRAQNNKFNIGDTVYLHTTADQKVGKKLRQPFTGPFQIIDLPGPVHAIIKRNRGTKLHKVHVSRLKLQPYNRGNISSKHLTATDDDDFEYDDFDHPVTPAPATQLPPPQQPQFNAPPASPFPSNSQTQDSNQPTVRQPDVPQPMTYDRPVTRRHAKTKDVILQTPLHPTWH